MTEWTPERRKLAVDHYKSGRSPEWIASELGSTTAAVKMALSRWGVKRPGMTTLSRPSRKPNADDDQGGLAARLAALQGLSPEPEAIQAPVPDETLRAWLDEPEAFFLWLGIALFPYQQEALSLIRKNDRTCIVWPRQHGKDLLTALYGLYIALVKSGAIVICVSPSQRQSDLWMDHLKAFALAKREIRDSVTDMSQSELAFVNGSKVFSLPSGAQGSATIRGFSRVTVLVVNEAAWVSEETFSAAQPFLAVSGAGAKLILASTPFGQSGYLWRSFNSDVFARHHVTDIRNPLIPPDFIEKERASMDAMTFASEWNATFISGQSSYFPTDLIQRCVDGYPLVESPLPEHSGMTFYLGCDWARIEGADRTVLTVVGMDKERHGKVLWVKSFDGVDYVTQSAYVEWLHGLWHFSAIYSDASNHAINDIFVSKMLPVVTVNFTVPSKVEMFSRLKASMEAGRLTIPNHQDMIRELSVFEYKISEHGNLLLHHPSGGHDDYPDSLALAARELTAPKPEVTEETLRLMAKLSQVW